MSKYIYVAGPYSQGDPILNTRKAIEVGEMLWSLGHNPFVPHLTLLWHLVSPQQLGFWYKYDNAWLVKCDGLVRLPGESPGSDKEVELAKENNIPVVLLKGDESLIELSLMLQRAFLTGRTGRNVVIGGNVVNTTIITGDGLPPQATYEDDKRLEQKILEEKNG